MQFGFVGGGSIPYPYSSTTMHPREDGSSMLLLMVMMVMIVMVITILGPTECAWGGDVQKHVPIQSNQLSGQWGSIGPVLLVVDVLLSFVVLVRRGVIILVCLVYFIFMHKRKK